MGWIRNEFDKFPPISWIYPHMLVLYTPKFVIKRLFQFDNCHDSIIRFCSTHTVARGHQHRFHTLVSRGGTDCTTQPLTSPLSHFSQLPSDMCLSEKLVIWLFHVYLLHFFSWFCIPILVGLHPWLCLPWYFRWYVVKQYDKTNTISTYTHKPRFIQLKPNYMLQ